MPAIEDVLINDEKKRIIIVGAGLVGSMEALFCAQRNYKVDVYEYRSDPRKQKYFAGRSINLALSARGRASLRAVGAEDYVLKTGIPMYARMLHSHSGVRTPMPYGKEGQYISSIDRRLLNEHLISLVDSNPNVNYYFNDKFVASNLKTGVATFENASGRHDESGHLIIGCDGAFSNIRKELMKITRMNYSQVLLFSSFHSFLKTFPKVSKAGFDLREPGKKTIDYPQRRCLSKSLENHYDEDSEQLPN